VFYLFKSVIMKASLNYLLLGNHKISYNIFGFEFVSNLTSWIDQRLPKVTIICMYEAMRLTKR
jgi:hypothetical protein